MAMSSVDLFDSVKRGSVEEVRIALQRSDIDVNCRGGEFQNTALCEAVQNNFVEILDLLLRHPAIDVHGCDKFGNNPLNRAACYNNVEIARRLLEHPDIDINIGAKSETFPPLTHAVYNNKVEMVDFLLKQPGIDVNVSHISGNSPLHVAALRNCVESARRLLEHASVNVNVREAGEFRQTPLHLAARDNSVETLNVLLEHHAIDPIPIDRNGNTPLHFAAWKNNVDCALRLLKHPRVVDNINHRGENLQTPLLSAAFLGATEVVDLLVKQPTIDVNAIDWNGSAPLHHAAFNNDREIACRLLHHSAIHINVRRVDWKTPLSLAAHLNSVEVLDLLLKQRGIDVNARDNDGSTPLHLAAMKNNTEIGRLLVEHPAVEVNLLAANMRTALHNAAELNHTEFVRLLVQHSKVNVNRADNYGCLPLHLACLKGHADTLRVLRYVSKKPLELGWKAHGGITPLHLAVNSGNQEVLQVLLDNPRSFPTLLQAVTSGFEKFTALHIAAQRGNAMAVEWILRIQREDILGTGLRNVSDMNNARDGLERTPLHYAAWNNEVAIVEHLLKEESLDVNAVDLDGYTALHLASKKGHGRLVELLLSHKDINPNATGTKSSDETTRSVPNDRTIPEVFGLPKLEPEWFHDPRQKMTPLHHALEEGHMEVVKHLLSHSATDVYLENGDHESAFHMAVRLELDTVLKDVVQSALQVAIRRELDTVLKDSVSRAFQVLRDLSKFNSIPKLLNHLASCAEKEGTDKAWDMLAFLWDEIRTMAREMHPQTKGQDETTLIHDLALAGLHGWMEGVLVCPRLDVNAVDLELQTPLHYATLAGDIEVVQVLLSCPRLSINAVDCHHQTPLHYASTKGYDEIVKLLLSLHSDINSVDNDERTSLPYADINALDIDHRTPLHCAALNGHTEVVEVLVQFKALRATKADKKGGTALQFAVESGKAEIEELLLEREDVSRYVDRLHRDRKAHLDATNAMLIGAALIAGVTFAGWLQPPLGYTPYFQFAELDPAAPPGTFESYAGIQQYLSIRVFWVCNSLSFFLAVATVISGALAVLPTQGVFVKEEVQMAKRALVVTSVLLVLAIAFVLGAFGASGFASLPPIISLELNMIVTCSIGVGFCVTLLALFLVKLYSLRPSWMRRRSSRASPIESTLVGNFD